jgi:glucose 1-dehydrogenase
VTGAETGIGRACAIALAEAGAAVCIGYRDEADEAETTRAQVAATGARTTLAQADVGDETAVDRLFAHATERLGTVDVLVHSAGVNAAGTHVVDLDLATWERTLRTNLTGPFLTARRFLRGLPEGTEGRIVVISSVHETMPALGVADYSSAKGGLHQFVRCLALEAAARRVTVNAVAPGTVLTRMTQELLDDPKALAEHLTTIPLGRAGRVEDIAAATVFLCGPGASYVTGTSITVDGGMLLNIASGPPMEG